MLCRLSLQQNLSPAWTHTSSLASQYCNMALCVSGAVTNLAEFKSCCTVLSETWFIMRKFLAMHRLTIMPSVPAYHPHGETAAKFLLQAS